MKTLFVLLMIPFVLISYSYIFPRFTFNVKTCEFVEGINTDKILVCVSPIFNWGVPFGGAFTNINRGLIVLSDANLEYVAHEVSHLCSKYKDEEQRATCTGYLTNKIYEKNN